MKKANPKCPQCKGTGKEVISHRGEREIDVCDCDYHIKQEKMWDEMDLI